MYVSKYANTRNPLQVFDENYHMCPFIGAHTYVHVYVSVNMCLYW